ncbi:MAG: TerB family tellurite resistance protein [Polyangiaceae bacterium]|nr:TerB family tellurite resistance protein [Polyangiaceae bacterium]
MAYETTELSLASLELPKLEACVELMFLVAYADGKIEPSEREVFRKHVEEATHGQIGAGLVQAVLRHVESFVHQWDRTQRIQSIAVRLSDQRVRMAALELAARVAVADGQLTADETAFLAHTGAAFELSQADISQALAVAQR